MVNDDKTSIEEVSAAYQELEGESSPPEIDALILQASKDSLVDAKAVKKAFPYQRYSIAASVCLSVMLVSFYLNNPPLNPKSIETELLKSIEVSQDLDFNEAQSNNVVSGDEEQNFQLRTVPKAAESRAAGAVEELVIQAQRRDTTISTTAISMGVLTEEEVENTQLGDIVLLNSVFDADLEDFAYRNNSEDWLLEIEFLLRLDEASAQEEINLFSQAYPEIEVESALAELNE